MNESTFSDRIKKLRKEHDMNQKEFAEYIGIRQATLSSYEKGTVTPSSETLLCIAQKFNISLDWLFGLSQTQINISTVGDIASFFALMTNLNEIEFELEINDHLPNDTEDENNRWFTSVKFWGNDKKHVQNSDICSFLSSLSANLYDLNHYFIDKELFDTWLEKAISQYSRLPLTKKPCESLSTADRIARRNKLLKQELTTTDSE